MTNDKFAGNLSDPFPGSRPGPITAILAVLIVGGGLTIHYWSSIKVTLGLG